MILLSVICRTLALCGTLTSSSGGWATENLSQLPGRSETLAWGDVTLALGSGGLEWDLCCQGFAGVGGFQFPLIQLSFHPFCLDFSFGQCQELLVCVSHSEEPERRDGGSLTAPISHAYF